jgi:predicted small lipoprotein YifL
MAYSVSALGTLNPSMRRTGISYLAFVFCCCLTLSLAACGQRGPLFLPEPEKQTGQEEPETATGESAEDKTGEGDEETPRA